MKHIILFILILNCFISTAQEFAIANSKLNILYVDIPNEINIAANKFECKDIKLVLNYGKVEPTEDPCKYIVTVDTYGKVKLSLYIKSNNQLIGEQEFRVHSIRAKYYDRFLVKSSSLSPDLNTTILANRSKKDSVNYRIKACIVSIVKYGEDVSVKEKKIYGSMCDEEVKKWFDELNPGDKVFFEEIEAYSTEGIVRRLGSIVYTIIC